MLVPVIGGKELNLHVLYVEVTRRGGYDKIGERDTERCALPSAGYPPASASTHQPCNVIVPYTPQLHQQGRRARRGGQGSRPPKPNRSGYNFFFAEKHSTLKSLYRNREREFTKMIGESWNNCPLKKGRFIRAMG
ncbi:UNVERIFIED_CONTAM: High mobility group B protein 9 [Sesamum radiatum]|uniref:High mobility group B protein 9 n=1 Tax=Sesamum radiatum TaxID=300843 RepID=A0AAW2PYA2_SESRA